MRKAAQTYVAEAALTYTRLSGLQATLKVTPTTSSAEDNQNPWPFHLLAVGAHACPPLSLHLCGVGSKMATRGRRHRASFVLSEMQGHQSNVTVDARPSCKMTKLLPLLLNTVPTAGKVLKMPTEDNPEAEAGMTQV